MSSMNRFWRRNRNWIGSNTTAFDLRLLWASRIVMNNLCLLNPAWSFGFNLFHFWLLGFLDFGFGSSWKLITGVCTSNVQLSLRDVLTITFAGQRTAEWENGKLKRGMVEDDDLGNGMADLLQHRVWKSWTPHTVESDGWWCCPYWVHDSSAKQVQHQQMLDPPWCKPHLSPTSAESYQDPLGFSWACNSPTFHISRHKKFLRRKLRAFCCWIDLFFSSLFTFPQFMQEIKKPKKNSYWYAKLDWIDWLSKRVSLHPCHLLQYLH